MNLLSQLGSLIAATNAMNKNLRWGGKSLFGLYLHIIVHHPSKSGQEFYQGRNLETGGDAEAVEGHCLLACSP